MRKLTVMALSAAIGFGICGCSPEARDRTSGVGQDVSEATANSGQSVATAAGNAKVATENALQTTKVKSALQSASGLDTKDLDVDTDTEAMTITLIGSVPDESQKNQAQAIAKGIGGNDFKVINNLKTAGK